MATGKTLQLRAIRPPAPRQWASGTFVYPETLAKQKAFAAQPARKGYETRFPIKLFEIQRIDRYLEQQLRARKRAWRGRWSPRHKAFMGGWDWAVPRMFWGLRAVSL